MTYQPPGSQAAPWWVWIRGDELGEDIVGVPTDDSAFRLLILHPWLTSLNAKQPTESLFAEWMRDRVRKDRSFEVTQWQLRRQLQIRDWLIMLKDANRWREDPSTDPTFFIPTEGNPFFRPATPIVFGMEDAYARDIIQGELEVFRKEKRFVRKNGQIVWGMFNVAAVLDANNRVLYFSAEIVDTTRLKAAETARKKAEAA